MKSCAATFTVLRGGDSLQVVKLALLRLFPIHFLGGLLDLNCGHHSETLVSCAHDHVQPCSAMLLPLPETSLLIHFFSWLLLILGILVYSFKATNQVSLTTDTLVYGYSYKHPRQLCQGL